MQQIAVFGTDPLAHAVAVGANTKAAGVLDALPPDAHVIVVSAEAHFDRLAPTIRALLRRGAHVVAACEEMAWPWYRRPHLADVIGDEAGRAGRAVLGLGGLIVERPLLQAAGGVVGLRRVDAQVRLGRAVCRPAVWRRLGIGLSPAKWTALHRAGTVDLMGVAETVTLLAQGLGFHPLHSEIRVTTRATASPGDDANDARGPVAMVGAHGTCRCDNRCDISLRIDVADVADPAANQSVTLEGDTTVRLTFDNTPSVASHAARLLAAAAAIESLPPGLHTALSLR